MNKDISKPVKKKTKRSQKKPSERMKKAFKNVLENGGNASKALRDAGYAPTIVKNPQKITTTKTWADLQDDYISDENLMIKHKSLLDSTRLEHMTFADGPRTEEEKERFIFLKQIKEDKKAEKGDELPKVIDCVSDEEIKDMLAGVNCVVKRIVHREMSRDVYYWAQDNKAVKDGLDMAYKIKGRYADKSPNNLIVPVQVNIHSDRDSYSS